MPQYALARHVFVCLQDEHVVFLDVHQDRYFALEAAKTSGLGEFVPGWPVPPRSVHESVEVDAPPQADGPPVQAGGNQLGAGTLLQVIDLLLEKGVLVRVQGDGGQYRRNSGKAATPVKAEVPLMDLTDTLDDPPPVGAGMLVRFTVAAICASFMLKYRTFENVIDRVARRLARPQSRDAVLDIERARQLVGVFATLRPFFFTSKNECLFDALALSEFLAAYAIYPRWVFAVQARPFAAHCWLQHGSFVFNDTVEHVRHYTPIMVV
jgi:hypothetical protein